jgi:Cu2+-exporting ATPase
MVHDSLIAAITVLIITCPCALALAVPAVQVVAAGRLFRSGVILNSGDAIERLAEVDTVVFDKTGTLTLPQTRVANAEAVPPDLLELAARLALSSRHPLAQAVAREAEEKQPFAEVIEDAGEGVRTVVDGVEIRLGSLAYCGLDGPNDVVRPDVSLIALQRGVRVAVFEIAQAVRPGAAGLIAALRQLGLDVLILSGDRPQAVAPVAQMIGVPDWQAGLTPTRKVAALKELKQNGRRVLMVGDGINDAPALAAAHVSLSPITAAELAQAHADAVFLGRELGPVRDALLTARKARALMRQNIALAVAYNICAIPIAIAGLVTPLIAALAMSGSSMLVTTNALRLHGRRDMPATETAPALPAGQAAIPAT